MIVCQQGFEVTVSDQAYEKAKGCLPKYLRVAADSIEEAIAITKEYYEQAGKVPQDDVFILEVKAWSKAIYRPTIVEKQIIYTTRKEE